MTRKRWVVLFLCITTALGTGQITNLESVAQPRLIALPSAPGPHVAKLLALKDDSWYPLFSPKSDSLWGKAAGRSWTPKMAYAPDLQGAFLIGSGTHGFLKADSHYQDDLWFYNINTNQWHCVWPGTKSTWRLKMVTPGWEADSNNMPVPVARCGHGYQIMSYDSDLKKFVFMATGDPYWGGALPLRNAWIPAGSNNYWSDSLTRCPFFYDVATGKWERTYTATGLPDMHGEWATEYIPTIKKLFRLQGTDVWFYDCVTHRWTKPATSGTPLGGYDVNMCYDTKRDRIYIGHYNQFSAFDIQTCTWLTLASAYTGSGVESNMTYDSKNDVVLSNVYAPAGNQTAMMRVYDPSTNMWRDLHGMLKRPGNAINAYYDPVLNVHVYHGETDSREDGTIVVYRYKMGETEQAEHPSVHQSLRTCKAVPNPSDAGTAIFATGLQRGSAVTLNIFNVAGRLIKTQTTESDALVRGVRWQAEPFNRGLFLVQIKQGSVVLHTTVLCL